MIEITFALGAVASVSFVALALKRSLRVVTNGQHRMALTGARRTFVDVDACAVNLMESFFAKTAIGAVFLNTVHIVTAAVAIQETVVWRAFVNF